MIDAPVLVSSEQTREWIKRLQAMPVADAFDREEVEAEIASARHLLEAMEEAGL
jgi:hypothetical protein